MAAQIINRSHGPEVEGTQVIVYRIMDFVRKDSSADRIANELHLTSEQVGGRHVTEARSRRLP